MPRARWTPDTPPPGPVPPPPRTEPPHRPRLTECPACGAPISREATDCPRCGHPGPRRFSAWSVTAQAVEATAGCLFLVGGLIETITGNKTNGLLSLIASILLLALAWDRH